MDMKAFFKLSYGLYVISAHSGGKDYGCVVNTLQQVTAQPAMLSVAINKNSVTTKAILESGRFCGVALTEAADMDLIGTFGFKNSEAVDKFAAFPTAADQKGVRYLTAHTAARYSCEVKDTLDLGSHLLVIGSVTEAEILSEEPVMTYDYYHRVVKGGTPPTAPSYKGNQEVEPAGKARWRCKICGYIYEGNPLPADFVCPICGQGADHFEKI
ncbi:MAG: flavin reductase [Oscillospiraceae bacterium]|nr:flavin reductase [Oscillospiraceae bacterium]